jgi:uncharacterized protein YegP (UPF0339 family)
MSSFGIHKDSNGEWYWLFLANNYKIICKSTDGYKNYADCLHSINLMKAECPTAIVIDMTKNTSRNR